jgi:hypothetical protein
VQTRYQDYVISLYVGTKVSSVHAASSALALTGWQFFEA